MRLEQDFLDGLTRITSSTLDNTGNPRRLTLLLSSGDTLDFGRRIDPATGGQMGPKKLVYVDSERVPCNAGAGRAMCYQVRDSAAQPWQLWYGDITGFNFQPGVRYRLRVVEVRDPNPPADASGEMGAGRGGRAGAGAALRPRSGRGPASDYDGGSRAFRIFAARACRAGSVTLRPCLPLPISPPINSSRSTACPSCGKRCWPARADGLKGTILLAEEGINLFLAARPQASRLSWACCARMRASPTWSRSTATATRCRSASCW